MIKVKQTWCNNNFIVIIQFLKNKITDKTDKLSSLKFGVKINNHKIIVAPTIHSV